MSMSTKFRSNQLFKSRAATPTPAQPTSNNAATRPTLAAGAHSASPVPVKDEVLQMTIHQYIAKLSPDDKEAFQSAPDIIEHLRKMQQESKSPISSSLTARVEKVLQCIKYFMSSLSIFIQHHPEVCSLVVGGVNCILTVSTGSTCYQFNWIYFINYY